MADLTATNFATNHNKVASIPVDQIFGAEARLFSLTVTPSSGNLNTTPTTANSNYAKALRALQQHVEVFYVSAADTTSLTFMANRNTFNAGGQGANATYGGTDDTTSIDASPSFENAEEAIKDAIGGTPSIAEVTITGTTIA